MRNGGEEESGLKPCGARMQGHVAWISGGASGIGRATAKLFAAEGASVAIVDRKSDVGQAAAKEISEAGGDAIFIASDVGVEGEVEKSIQRTIDAYGRISNVVNNAGVVDVQPLHEYTSEGWDRIMAINLKSMFFSFKYAFPYLQREENSYVVNVGSISSFVGQSNTPVYTTSKHAILGLTRSIALDYASKGIRCNCVCPGITDTPMLWEHLNKNSDPQGMMQKRLMRVPLGKALSPHDVARTILFLSCEDSSGTTGTSVTIDGGYLTAAEWENEKKEAAAHAATKGASS